MKFQKLKIELERRADEKKYEASQRAEAVEFFQAELNLQKASLNSSILTQKRVVSKTEKEMAEVIYTLEPNLERFDELNARKSDEEAHLEKLEAVFATRVQMLTEMV